jgi:hypothetical protein
VATAPGRAAAFGTFKIDVYNGPSGTAAVVAVDVDMSTGQPLAIWIGKSPIPAGAQGQWATIDESSATYDWEKLSATGIGDGAAGTSTLAAFSSAHPDGANDRHGYVGFLVFGCYGETGWAINHIQTGTVAAPNVTDLGTLADDVHINAGSNFIVTGQAVGLSGDSQYAGPTSAILSFRPANQSTYSTATRSLPQEPVNDLTCSANGSSCRNPFPVIMAHPVYNTVYRWTYPGGNGVDGAASTFITVHVQAKIAATFPSSLSNNSVLMVPGQLAPACSNTMVTLWGLHGGVKTKMATVSSGEQGSFIIGAGVHGRGSWSFWITSPNDACNAAAKSTTKTYTVR